MARITVDDCLKNVKNRFELVHIAAERTRQLEERGDQSLLESQGDRNTLVALREIAEGHVGDEILEKFVQMFGKSEFSSQEDMERSIQNMAQEELKDRELKALKEKEELEQELLAADNKGAVKKKRGRPPLADKLSSAVVEQKDNQEGAGLDAGDAELTLSEQEKAQILAAISEDTSQTSKPSAKEDNAEVTAEADSAKEDNAEVTAEADSTEDDNAEVTAEADSTKDDNTKVTAEADSTIKS